MCRKLTNVAIQLLCLLSACDSGGFDSHRPTKLTFTLQPTSAIAGAAIPVAVAVQDADGNTIANASTSITVATGTNAGSGTLSGSTTVAAVNGVAIFSNLILDKSGTGYTLTADATGLIGATSSPFNVMEAIATVTVTPGHSSVVAGTLLNLTATILDAAGNVLSGRTITWTTSDWRSVPIGQPCRSHRSRLRFGDGHGDSYCDERGCDGDGGRDRGRLLVGRVLLCRLLIPARMPA